MILNLNYLPINVLFPKNKTPIFDDSERLKPFSDEIISALSQLGLFLMKEGRTEPSIVAAGYWLRKKQLLELKSQYKEKTIAPKGTVFHIAPGNVDTLFFYSMIISVLCGNQTILRISNKLSDDTRTFISLIDFFFTVYQEFADVQSLMNIVQYDHNNATGIEITKKLSLFSDARVVWGGDHTVKGISKIPKKYSDSDIAFPDRYSVAVIQLSNEQQIDQSVNNLLSDIKPFKQQACSSPKVVYWLNTNKALQVMFWQGFAKKLNEQVSMLAPDLISQLVYLQRLPLMTSDELDTSPITVDNGLLKCVDVTSITLDMINSHCGLWVFLNQSINHLDDIILFDHCQTVTVSGIDQTVWQIWENCSQQPMKRIVPAGQTLAFSHVWDGIDLIVHLTE